MSFTINVDYSKLAAGDYNILYLVDTLNALAETSETNNMLKLSAAPLHVTAPFVDLDITSATNLWRHGAGGGEGERGGDPEEPWGI